MGVGPSGWAPAQIWETQKKLPTKYWLSNDYLETEPPSEHSLSS